ncbi:DUF2975 domain-containing protein [Candidatus Aminicenantes bacterium AH-873-B07]|jgi:hypothetical protein|nr:DUF2975 domain-containing protein [Candidatus Aminicenantes bacterium AH-873-B07]
MNRIRNLSRIIRIIGQVIFYLTLIGVIVALTILSFGSKIDLIEKSARVYLFGHKVGLFSLGTVEKILISLTILLTIGIYLFGLYHFIKLFKLFEKGEIFTEKTIHQFKMLGLACIFYFPISVVSQLTKWYVVLSVKLDAHPGISQIFKDFDIFVVGIAVILISWIMNEGKKLKDEQDLVV